MSTGLPTRKSPRQYNSVTGTIERAANAIWESALGRQWPSAKWANDPVGFGFYILGVEGWKFQHEFLMAIQENSRVACSGGRKIGKDFSIAWASVHWYATREDGRVFFTATNNRQVETIAYREVRKLFARSGRCVDCKRADAAKIAKGQPPGPRPCPHSAILTGSVGELARTGIVAADFREIKGATSKDPEGLAGLSGQNLLAIVDEASGYPDELFHAIRGNLAASGCREVLISNPTRSTGFFFDAFHKPATMELYKTFQVSSLETPNYIEGRDVFPGLASRAWVEECEREWGRDSPLFKVHVLGQFVLNEEGAVFSIQMILDATERHESTEGDGRLSLGIDPAGDSGKGDESAFAARRGKKILGNIHTRRGLTPEGHLIEALGILNGLRRKEDREIPRIVIDRDGEQGARVWAVFKGYEETHEGEFELIGFRGSDKAFREPLVYMRVRDELYASFRDWFRNDGAIPQDLKLSKELNAFRFMTHVSGKTQVCSKDELRKALGRSPDRADACALACWESRTESDESMAKSHVKRPRPDDEPTGFIDPYRPEKIDPYRTEFDDD